MFGNVQTKDHEHLGAKPPKIFKMLQKFASKNEYNNKIRFELDP